MVAVSAIVNERPLQYQFIEGSNLLTIVEKNDNRILFRGVEAGDFIYPHYLGAILTNDRMGVIYVNNSAPLP